MLEADVLHLRLALATCEKVFARHATSTKINLVPPMLDRLAGQPYVENLEKCTKETFEKHVMEIVAMVTDNGDWSEGMIENYRDAARNDKDRCDR